MLWHVPTLITFENSDLKTKHEISSLVSAPWTMPRLSLCLANLLSFLMAHCSGHSEILFQLSTLKETNNPASLGRTWVARGSYLWGSRHLGRVLSNSWRWLSEGTRASVLFCELSLSNERKSTYNNLSRKNCWDRFLLNSSPLISFGYKVGFLWFLSQRATCIWFCLTEHSLCLLESINS